VDYAEKTATVEDDAPLVPRGMARASFEYFRQGLSVEEVARRLNRALSTTCGYLLDFIRHESIPDPSPWVPVETARRIEAAAASDHTGRLRPIFDSLGGTVSYEEIRVVLACRQNQKSA
jgi:ATP-dependent DNA helicase RecQ